MKNMNSYQFTVDKLHYLSVERPILNHYGLGMQDHSSLPPRLSAENDSGTHSICGTQGEIVFDLEISPREDGTYDLTCYPQDITRYRK